jgi:catechol 2,3-dioxygenase-like lactoylglutathione lyase family enzyme
MARTTGFDRVATVTADLDRIVAFYQHVFDARITFAMAATQDHPRMVILDLGGGSALNITEQPGPAPRRHLVAVLPRPRRNGARSLHAHREVLTEHGAPIMRSWRPGNR